MEKNILMKLYDEILEKNIRGGTNWHTVKKKSDTVLTFSDDMDVTTISLKVNDGKISFLVDQSEDMGEGRLLPMGGHETWDLEETREFIFDGTGERETSERESKKREREMMWEEDQRKRERESEEIQKEREERERKRKIERDEEARERERQLDSLGKKNILERLYDEILEKKIRKGANWNKVEKQSNAVLSFIKYSDITRISLVVKHGKISFSVQQYEDLDGQGLFAEGRPTEWDLKKTREFIFEGTDYKIENLRTNANDMFSHLQILRRRLDSLQKKIDL